MGKAGFTADESAESKPMRVPRGMFLLRYVSSPDGSGAPEIVVTTLPGSGIAFLTQPDEQAGPDGVVTLGVPGHAVAVRADQDGEISISIGSEAGQSRRRANVTLEPIFNSTKILARASVSRAAAAAETDERVAVDVLAHVSRRGDVLVQGGEWVCGPNFPMAIEGIELRLSDPLPGLDIMTSATVNARGRKTLAPAPIGSFVGTRGKAAPLVGVSFALSGPLAEQCSLSCEALFLGAAIVVRSGSRIELSGPTGHEPLVGLRVALKRRNEAEVDVLGLPKLPLRMAGVPSPVAATPDLRASSRSEAVGTAGRVRVFRTSREKALSNIN